MSFFQDNFGALTQGYDICVLGSEKSGKTSLVLHYIHGKYIDSNGIPDEDLYTKVLRTGQSYNEVTILDVNPKLDNYTSSRKMQILNNSGMIFAYSITDRGTLFELEDIYDRVSGLREGDMPPVVVVGLHSDMEGERSVTFEEGEDFAERVGAIKFLEASSKWGLYVDEVFAPLVKILGQRQHFRRRLSLVHAFGSPSKDKDTQSEEKTTLKSKNIQASDPVLKDPAVKAPEKVHSILNSNVKSVKDKVADSREEVEVRTISKEKSNRATKVTNDTDKASSSCCVIV